MAIDTKYKRISKSGKRKRAIARATIIGGSGKVKINNKDYKSLQYFDLLRIAEVLRIAENVLGKLDFDIRIDVHGGGEKGQIEASRTALARSILAFSQSKELEKLFLEYDRNMLIADVRRKESRKPGDSKARKKRQTSYR